MSESDEIIPLSRRALSARPAPYLDDLRSPWPLIGFVMLFPAAFLIVRHRRKRTRPLA